MENIRNFVIIAHIDHGKSTLADRLLEATGTVEKRKMQEQYLDQLELERERGITIKMAPVRMVYEVSPAELKISNSKLQNSSSKQKYILNLIDTPGHSDFSYEVSRALEAVEGAILLVDATKGVQAQTLSNFRAAQKAGLAIVGAVNKIDAQAARTEETVVALAELLDVHPEEIFRVSAKTGTGVEELLEGIISRVPPPTTQKAPRGLVFDSLYDDHRGIIAFVRVFGGVFPGDGSFKFLATGRSTRAKEVGYFTPQFTTATSLRAGEIGYIATGLKEAEAVKIGDTVTAGNAQHRPRNEVEPLEGYREPQPTVFISIYPDSGAKFADLKQALERLNLTDAALQVEPDANEALGRGLKVGFLGQLHFEIITSRLEQEYGLEFITSFPSIAYRVQAGGEEHIIKEPHAFPSKPDTVWEPVICLELVTPAEHLQKVLSLQQTFDLEVGEVETRGDQVVIEAKMPLAELIRDFDDRLKSVSQGYASFNYELCGDRVADVVKMEVLVAGDVVSALTRVVPRRDVEREARVTAERLKELLPKVQVAQPIQVKVDGRIIARETIPALKKDVTGHLYGGDRTRKMKLWKKQKQGKKRMEAQASVHVPREVFRRLLEK